MRRNILIALSLANLWYLRVWSELLTYSRADTYLMVHPPRPVDYIAVMLNVLIAAAVFLCAQKLVELVGRPWFTRLAIMGFVAALVIPLNAVREVLGNQFPEYLKSPLLDHIGVKGVLLVVVVLGAAAAVTVFRYSKQAAHLTGAALLLLSPFCMVTFGQAVWRALHYDAAGFESLPVAPKFADAARKPHLVWFICDEWDYRLTFLDRDRSLSLPQIDRLSKESLFATEALPPGSGTPESIPSYFSGQLLAPVWYAGTRELMAQRQGESRATRWTEQPNIFEQTRAAGFDTALVEWFHPTCRVLTGLNFCEWWPMARQYNSTGDTLTEIIPHQARSLAETSLFSVFGRPLTADQHTGVYHALMAEARRVIVDPSYNFTVVHLPVPHNPFMYDRRTGTFTLGNSPIKGYIDHLALLDRTIGDLRQTMERAGVWDSTTVLFTSDHPFRSSETLDGKSDPRIPYLLKVAGQHAGLTYSTRFNAVVTGSLLLSVLQGQISTASDAAAWLDRAAAVHDSTVAHTRLP